MYLKLKCKLAVISAALNTANATAIVCDLLFSRALPIFAFLSTMAFSLVCMFNMLVVVGLLQSYTPIPLTIFWYGFGVIFGSSIALALSIVSSLHAYTALRRARYAVQEQITKLLADKEAAELEAKLKNKTVQELISAYIWVYNALRVRDTGWVATPEKSKIYREALARNDMVNGCLDCQYMRPIGPYRNGVDYHIPEWQCAHPNNWEDGKEKFSFQDGETIVVIPQWPHNPNCPRHKNFQGEK